MGKKNVTKSADQRLRLEGFYERRQGGWQREEIMAISRAAGLTRQQVYKWLWDRKRAEKQKTRIHAHSYGSSRSRWVHYSGYRVQVPTEKQQADVFFVHPGVSVWALLVLRSQGWQLIRDAPNGRSSSLSEGVPHRVSTAKQSILTNGRKSAGKEEEIFESEP